MENDEDNSKNTHDITSNYINIQRNETPFFTYLIFFVLLNLDDTPYIRFCR